MVADKGREGWTSTRELKTIAEGKGHKRTLHGAIERNARLVPDRPAIIWDGIRLSWSDLSRNLNRTANALLRLGVKAFENVGIMLRNSNQYVEAFAACGAIKARPFNINYRYKEDELKYVLENADGVVVICNPEYEETLEAVRPGLPLLRQIIVCGTSRHGNPEWDEVVGKAPAEPPAPPWGIGDNRTEILFYTGGTTGMPKGVLWPQENIIRMIANNISNSLVKNLGLLAEAPPPSPSKLLEMLDLPLRGSRAMSSIYLKSLSNQRIMGLVGAVLERYLLIPPGSGPLIKAMGKSFTILLGSPLMHGAAWVGAIPVIAAGGTLYFLPDSLHFDPHSLWSLVEREHIHIIEMVGDAFAVPMLEALEDREYDLRHVMVLGSGAVKLSPYMKEKLHEKLPNAMIADTLLATEGGGAVSEASISTEHKSSRNFRIRSSGKFPVMVIDEDGEFVQPGSDRVGVLAYSGPQSIGYWKDPEKTAATYVEKNGRTWVMIGDMCTVQSDGTIDLIGRSHGCINSGGEKIYPYEVENIFFTHPAVRDVAVIGVPDPRWGEAVTAVVELVEGWNDSEELSQELNLYIREKISDYKCPKHYVFVASLDRSDAGKVFHSNLRRRAIEALGMREEEGAATGSGTRNVKEHAEAGGMEKGDGGAAMEYKYLQLSVEEGVGALTINRPPGNAISVDLAEEFISMAKDLTENEEVRCVLLRSDLPKYFMVGADLRTFPPELVSDIDFSRPQEEVLPVVFDRLAPHIVDMLKRGQEMMNAVERIPKPTVAVIGGHALGGGLELCMACDFRIMARGRPRVGLTETSLSLIPSAGGTQRLPRLVGRAKALEMVLLGKKLDADEAEALGLVTMAVDPDILEEEALSMGKALAHGATMAMACAKRCIIDGEDIPIDRGLDLETEAISMLTKTHDMLEGIMAFTQGREPHYAGK
ncbi:MAG: AMP-binding protein [Actinobacteria bacterium]|nr:AMP-binding protein [Actinomycetota bacterium]